jgi:hypothetical protein
MRIEHSPNLPALRREWRLALIVGAAGGILLLSVAALIAVDFLAATPPAPPRAPSISVQAARIQEDIAICDAALAAVQSLGILPAFAVRDGDETRPGGAPGRYVCGAKTDAARYTVTFDLTCKRLGAGCIVPQEVTQDGTSIYRRP